MTDKRAEEVWRNAIDAMWEKQGRTGDGDDAGPPIIAAALAQAKRAGVEAMRDAAKIDNYEELDLEKRLDEIAARLLASAPPEAPDKLAALPFRAILNWFMCSDLWPASEKDHGIITAWIEAESQARRYRGWVDAYHEEPEPQPEAKEEGDG